MLRDIYILWAAELVCLMIMSYPLAAALVVGVAYGRKNHPPPVWVAALVWLKALAAGMMLHYFPLQIPWYLALPAVAGILACGVVGSAAFLGRREGTTFRKGMAMASVAAALVMVWADLRFFIVVRDQYGNLAEWTGGPPMCHPGRGPITDDAFAYGPKPVKGVIYIGLFKWLEYRDGWLVLATRTSSAGPAGWWGWPRSLTTD